MRRAFGHALLVCVAVATAPAQTRPLPTELADSTFWRMVSTFSEPEQTFATYMVSNEVQFPELVRTLGFLTQSGAYIGVAPEQNYHYIAAIEPPIAFILDIRRQAVIQHLMFKAVFELSPTRADFISLLTGRPRPAGLSDSLGAYRTWDAFWNIRSDPAGYKPHLTRLLDHLTKTHGFALTSLDSSLMDYTYGSFYRAGPDLISSGNAGPSTAPSTFANLTSAVDAIGIERSFLATNAQYQVVRRLHLKNLVIPVVGDFAGTHALRSIGQYLREHGTPVAAFYLSNVEQYLGLKTDAFGANVASLPTHASSVLLRGIPPLSFCKIQKWLASNFVSCY
jgi:hypothetical protein